MKKTIILIFAALLIFAFASKKTEASEAYNPPSAYCMLQCYPRYVACLGAGGSVESCDMQLYSCLQFCSEAYPNE